MFASQPVPQKIFSPKDAADAASFNLVKPGPSLLELDVDALNCGVLRVRVLPGLDPTLSYDLSFQLKERFAVLMHGCRAQSNLY